MARERTNHWVVPIIVALIGLFGTCIVAFVNVPAFQDWFGSLFTSSNSEVLAIESIPQNIFVFAGNDENGGGRGVFYLLYDDEHFPIYRMDYSLPADKYGYAGLVFQFPGGYNLSAYKALEFTIVFKESLDEIDLFLKDISDNEGKIHISGNSDNEMSLTYEFSNFQNVNFNAVKEIGVIASTDFATGDHEMRIKNIRFVK